MIGKLIRMIIEIIKGIRSFIFIMVFLIFGFALICFVWNHQYTFGQNLFVIYNLLFANADPAQFSRPEILYYVIITSVLSILLLNVLIAIMGDTYQKVLTHRVLAEGQEKVSLILEATYFVRAFRKLFGKKNKLRKALKKKSQKAFKRLSRLDSQMLIDEEEERQFEKHSSKEFLYFAQIVDRKSQYLVDFFDWDSEVKSTNRNAILPSEEEALHTVSSKPQFSEFKSILEQQDQRIKELERVVKSGFDELEKKLQVKMEEILTAVLEETVQLRASRVVKCII